jgi:hypothetical protein
MHHETACAWRVSLSLFCNVAPTKLVGLQNLDVAMVAILTAIVYVFGAVAAAAYSAAA